VFFDDDPAYRHLCLEGVKENRKFLRIHSRSELLGSEELEKVLIGMSAESPECRNIGDVYREPQFINVDFPSMVRSLVCIPVTSVQRTIGLLIMSHSRPRYFNDNHIRVLKILASFAAHLKLLTGKRTADVPSDESTRGESADLLSLVALEFEVQDSYRRWVAPDTEILCSIRTVLFEALGGKGAVLFRGERELIALLPGFDSHQLHGTVCAIRNAFHAWRASQTAGLSSMRMNLGCATCEGEDDLERALEIAGHLMHPETEQEDATPVEIQ
jgi:hypothetical protein